MTRGKGEEMKSTSNRQRGVGVVGMILIAAAVIFVAVLGMKLVPPYIRNAQINQIFRTIVGDPSMQNATIREIKESFNKRANIEYITDMTGDDIEISKEGNSISLNASYEVKVPVVGNVSLLLEFNPSSD